MIQQLTPNLPTDAIEPSAEFFGKVGFNVAVRVPDEGAMDFAILVNDSQQVMYQTRQSLTEDDSVFANAGSPVFLYVTVSDLDGVAAKLDGFEVAMKERTTFYGAREISYREPSGHIVTFAEFPDRAE
jgi:predicted lactoylglutathione lyase